MCVDTDYNFYWVLPSTLFTNAVQKHTTSFLAIWYEILLYQSYMISCNLSKKMVKQSLYRYITEWEGSSRFRLVDCMIIGTRRWYGCQPKAPTVFTPRKYSWYSFMLEAESIPVPLCGRKNYVNEKFRKHHREWNPRSSGCRGEPQPTTSPRAPV